MPCWAGSQERRDYLAANPDLKGYWEERRAYLEAHPELAAYVNQQKQMEGTAPGAAGGYTPGYTPRAYGGRGGGRGGGYGDQKGYTWGTFVSNVGQDVANAVRAYWDGKPLSAAMRAKLEAEFAENPLGFATLEEWLAFLKKLYGIMAMGVPALYKTRPMRQQEFRPTLPRKRISWG